MSDVIEVEGIGEVYALKLKKAGIATTDDLLEAGSDTRRTAENRPEERHQRQANPALDQSR